MRGSWPPAERPCPGQKERGSPDTYDDLATLVLRKGNAILYAGFAQIKNTGERADSGAKAAQVMKQALARLP